MPGNFLRLAEDRILVEQLRLLQGHVRDQVIPACLLYILMAWILTNDANATALWTWCAAAILSRLNIGYYAHRHLASGIAPGRARGMVWTLIALHAADGAIMSALAWVTLDSATAAGSILVITVLAGSLGSAMAQFSPVLPIFFTKAALILAPVVTKLWLMDEAAYEGLGVVCILYLFSLTTQARASSRATRAVIELRFENIELLDKLRRESENAHAMRLSAEQARREAERANAAKSKFLAAASHDLRQPIHAQGLFMGALARTELGAHQREILASANAASQSSVEMLNTLLDFSRIEAGVVEPCVLSFHLQPLLNKIEREFGSQADAKGLAYRSREADLAVRSDPMLVELILRNLVSNAIRYTAHGGLLVACRKRGDHAVLEVWDTGIGIAPAHQREVFREFHQLGNPERDRQKGLGLGLAIADGLARALGHDLSLASAPQRGSVFRLALPLAAEMPVEKHALAQPRTLMLNVRVLVLDDDEAVRAGMLHLLHDWGCECDTAGSIEDALELARARAPDLVISDYRLREQHTGIAAITALRALLGEGLPALLVTGDTAPERLREAQASGIPLLHKPVSPGQLYRGLVAMLPH